LTLLGEEKCEEDAGRPRGAKNGRFAALREFGGSSEYREWMRGGAEEDWVVSMVGRWRYMDVKLV
jgi:hypothetical protein